MDFYMVMKDGRFLGNVETLEEALALAGVDLTKLRTTEELNDAEGEV